jgi:DegV family protein with EDD domain
MNKEKIAVLTDSGSDIEKTYADNLFVLPLTIQIDEQTYIDGVDITLDQVLQKLDTNKITTSLPKPEVIIESLDKIKSFGYTHVIINTISSGLSGTHNVIRMLIEDCEGLTIGLVDTKNISKGSGYTSYKALELIEQGKSFNEIMATLESTLDDQKVFFTIGTIEYLRRGGRIGLVAGTVASILHIKPIISCNEKGVYYTVKKTRGYQNAIRQLIEVAHEFASEAKAYDITILVAKVDEKIEAFIEEVKALFNNARKFEIRSITPALAIHTGPEAFGVVVRKLN